MQFYTGGIKTLRNCAFPSNFFFTMAQQPHWAKALSLSRIHDHTQTHNTRQDSSGRVTSATKRPLPDNTQHSQQTEIHAPSEIWTRNTSKWVAADLRLKNARPPGPAFLQINQYKFGISPTAQKLYKHLLRRHAKSYCCKTQQTGWDGSDTSVPDCTRLFYMHFSLLAARSRTLEYAISHLGPGWRSWYSDSLRAGRSEDRIPVEARFSAPVRTDPGAHPASCTLGTWSFPEVKLPERGFDHPPLLAPRLKEE
jgi:hypothetical protein